MVGRIVLAMVTSLLAAAGVWYAFEGEGMYSRHQFASEEAQKSLEVTEAQSAELLASARKSDSIVFALYGSLLAAVAGWFCHPLAAMSGRVKGALAGIVLGAIGGVLTAQVGHWFDRAIPFPQEPMLYWIGRWVLMVLPTCLAAGVAVALAGQFVKHVGNAVAGSVLGGVIAIILYSLLTGSVTPIEGHQYIYPANPGNRLMAMGLVAAVVPGMIALQVGRAESQVADDAASADNEEQQS